MKAHTVRKRARNVHTHARGEFRAKLRAQTLPTLANSRYEWRMHVVCLFSLSILLDVAKWLSKNKKWNVEVIFIFMFVFYLYVFGGFITIYIFHIMHVYVVVISVIISLQNDSYSKTYILITFKIYVSSQNVLYVGSPSVC